MKLTEFLADERTWLAAGLVTTLIGTYFYLESVVSHVDSLRTDFIHAKAYRDREQKQWLDEEMRHLQRLGSEHAELRRMILDMCKE